LNVRKVFWSYHGTFQPFPSCWILEFFLGAYTTCDSKPKSWTKFWLKSQVRNLRLQT